MIKVYANLILKGLKALDDVPENLRLAVETLVEKLKSQTLDN
jgi:hypothetical protein